jgi:hypothetical protein
MRTVPAGNGFTWIASGWRLFAPAWLMWIIAMLVILIIAILLHAVPLAGAVAWQLANPVFFAGLMAGCASLESGGDFEIEHVFAGFRRHFGSLVVVGLVMFVAEFVLVFGFVAFAGIGVLTGVATAASGEEAEMMLAASAIPILLGALVVSLLALPLLMAYWFAPALVALDGMAPLTAMKTSFMGCLKNVLPTLLYGVAMFVLLVLAIIPFGLGLLVWVPLAFTTTYAAYRDIFTTVSAPAPA